jgi:glycosyltransferase involved in cell wall biosynthesis
LDLYRPEDPFRWPARREFRTPLDVAEYGLMSAGSFPEPFTFATRARRLLGGAGGAYDVVHDNQSLGYGLLALSRRVPTIATIHHPISIDRRIAMAAAEGWAERLGKRRWYGFVRMQARVARRLPRIITVSDSARRDIERDFRVPGERIAVVPNGVDPDLYRPLPEVPRVRGRIVTIASSDQPSKGLGALVEAVAKLRTEREVELVIVGKGGIGATIRDAAARWGIGDAVRPTGRLDALEVVRCLAEAEVAVVPSLYEGFSLPAIEAMATGTPLVATSVGALPEVIGEAGLLVEAGNAGALAAGIARVMDEPALATRLGELGRLRALARFTWASTAASTVDEYRKAMHRADC